MKKSILYLFIYLINKNKYKAFSLMKMRNFIITLLQEGKLYPVLIKF